MGIVMISTIISVATTMVETAVDLMSIHSTAPNAYALKTSDLGMSSADFDYDEV